MKEGVKQGDMSPVVKDYQRGESTYPERDFGKTTEYIARQDRIQRENSSNIKAKAYKGRYN